MLGYRSSAAELPKESVVHQLSAFHSGMPILATNGGTRSITSFSESRTSDLSRSAFMARFTGRRMLPNGSTARIAHAPGRQPADCKCSLDRADLYTPSGMRAAAVSPVSSGAPLGMIPNIVHWRCSRPLPRQSLVIDLPFRKARHEAQSAERCSTSGTPYRVRRTWMCHHFGKATRFVGLSAWRSTRALN